MQILLVKFQDKDQILNNLNSFREAIQWLTTINSIGKIPWSTKIKCQTCLTKTKITKINKWAMTSNHIQVWIKIIKTNSKTKWTNSTGSRLNNSLQEDLWESQEPSNCLISQLRSPFSVVATICQTHRAKIDSNKIISSSKVTKVWTRIKIRTLISNRTSIKTKDITKTSNTTTWTSWIKTKWIIWGNRTIMIISQWTIWITWIMASRCKTTKWTRTTWTQITRTTWTIWTKWTMVKITWITRWTIWIWITTKCNPRICHSKTIWWTQERQAWTKMHQLSNLITHHHLLCQLNKMTTKIPCKHQFKRLLKLTSLLWMRQNKWMKLLTINRKVLSK